jgi:hypothetical protein
MLAFLVEYTREAKVHRKVPIYLSRCKEAKEKWPKFHSESALYGTTWLRRERIESRRNE